MKNKVGLVLEGGAMRGLFTAGIIDVFLENNILVDGVIGVSAGAAFGCNYISKQKGRVIRYNTQFCKDPRYCSFRSLLKTGDLYGAEFCYKTIPQKLDLFDHVTYKKSNIPFYVVATDIITGTPVYKKCDTCNTDNELDWIRASASMPIVSRIVEIDSYKLLDGGISDSIPIKFFQSIGYNKNIVILTQPKGFIKKKNKLLPLIRILYRKYPKLIQTISRRHIEYNKTLSYLRGQEDIFVIQPPDKLPIKQVEHNPEVMRTVYNIGRKTAENQIDQIIEFLQH